MAQAGSIALAHDALLPRPPGGNAPGAALALVVHAALAAALTVSVDWRAQTPDIVSAELWAAVPQAAAPAAEVAPTPSPTPPAPEPTPTRPPAPAPAPTPAPVPAEPDIATQRAERRKLEAERERAAAAAEAERQRVVAEAEAERKRVAANKKRADDKARDDERKQREQAERDAREARAEDERLARQREENLRRMMGQAGGATGGTGPANSSGTAAQSAAPSAAYAGRLRALIRGNLVYTGSTPDNNAAEVEVSAAASGTIISRRLLKSSGHKDWDEAVLRAIDRTPALPRDVDGRVPSRLIIAFKPRE